MDLTKMDPPTLNSVVRDHDPPLRVIYRYLRVTLLTTKPQLMTTPTSRTTLMIGSGSNTHLYSLVEES
jgi:hypothetical protein